MMMFVTKYLERDFVPAGHTEFQDMDDSKIVILAQAGIEEASEYLLYKYRNLVRNRVRSYFLVGAEKEDLLQVGMIGLWQAVIDYSPDKAISFPAFARICIQRHIITAIKTATRQKQIPLNTSLSLESPTDESNSEWTLSDILTSSEVGDPEDLVLQRENSKQIQEMLQRMLSDFEWHVLARYKIGKSYREIASELRCKTKSVDNALTRIKKKMSCTSLESFD
jgi:RNA polymerase sporulation-specific sigma factor